MKPARRILDNLGSLLVDFVGLFLGYPEQEGHPRRSVGEALLYLGLVALVVILQATMLAMQRAVAGLAVRAESALVDGNRCPRLDVPVEAVVKGDGKIAWIAAASILAKTVRDAGMLALHAAYPQYGFDRHMCYPTAAQFKALQEHGASPVHRRSFGPVAAQLSLL